MTYRISRRANADIEAICDYIAKENLAAADSLDLRLHTRLKCFRNFLEWDTLAKMSQTSAICSGLSVLMSLHTGCNANS